ncbi:hypothetical protein KR222_007090 [Zaprionus bogoriensis]|nr:hypothetical protein KR222_007090 [Zaprionus bogoriensis]
MQFKQIGDKFYCIEHVEKFNWFKADAICRDMGGHLVDFQNKEEFDMTLAHLKQNISYWIGFSDLATEGEFTSVVTGRKPIYLNWHVYEPSNGSQMEHCGGIWYSTNKHLMNDFDCRTSNAFICESACTLHKCK